MTRSTPTTEQLTSYRDELWTREYGGASSFSLETARALWQADQDRSEALVANRARQAEARRQRQAVRDAQRGVGEDLPPETYEEAFLRATVDGLEGLREKLFTEPLPHHRQHAWDALASSVSTIVQAEAASADLIVDISPSTITIMSETRTVSEAIPAWVTDSHLPDVALQIHAWTIRDLVFA